MTRGEIVGGESAGGAFERGGGGGAVVVVAGFGFALGAEGFGFQAVDFLVYSLEGGHMQDAVTRAGHTMFLTCSGVRGDLGSTPGLEGAVCGGGVEGRSVILTVNG